MSNRAAGRDAHEPTMWTGWITFAGLMMMVIGFFHAMQGLFALFRDGYFLVGTDALPVAVDWTTWGWIHLSLGVIVAWAGAVVTTGRTWAKVVTVLFALVSAIVELAFLPAYPIWSGMMITLSVLVVWAVLVHGDELRVSRR